MIQVTAFETTRPIPAIDLGPYVCIVCRRKQTFIWPGSEQICPDCDEKTRDMTLTQIRQLARRQAPDTAELTQLRKRLEQAEMDCQAAEDDLDEARHIYDKCLAQASQLDDLIHKAEKDAEAIAALMRERE